MRIGQPRSRRGNEGAGSLQSRDKPIRRVRAAATGVRDYFSGPSQDSVWFFLARTAQICSLGASHQNFQMRIIMKTSCTRHSNTSTSQLLKRSLLAITATLALAALNAVAQVTPLSVGSGGVTNTFSTSPTLAQGWSTMSYPGGNGDITTVAQMDAAMGTNAVAGIVTQIPTDTGGAQFATG